MKNKLGIRCRICIKELKKKMIKCRIYVKNKAHCVMRKEKHGYTSTNTIAQKPKRSLRNEKGNTICAIRPEEAVQVILLEHAPCASPGGNLAQARATLNHDRWILPRCLLLFPRTTPEWQAKKKRDCGHGPSYETQCRHKKKTQCFDASVKGCYELALSPAPKNIRNNKRLPSFHQTI